MFFSINQSLHQANILQQQKPLNKTRRKRSKFSGQDVETGILGDIVRDVGKTP